ncbi:hydrolase [Hahella sp. CCB-MM4]|uniref:HD domain-containing protein n=1 Tax=Hahella sp. (strain CCB-MM4) TaxID=1926491 RepID=UPI000B9B7527|nr:HD domain-containing protein [Hahella sp. CCB-MM4]OZG72278.1 hydrolase [Hahella sp. CCB-MM4]
MEHLPQQLEFLREIDQLKGIIRQTLLIDKSRKENSAEHSWHLAMYAMILSEYANEPVNVGRVIQMLLIHDIVEVDAGDVPLHGNGDKSEQEQREKAAADRLFGLLPDQQGKNLRTLWDEFEEATTPDARFAKALDRLQPVLHNLATDGGTWETFNVDEAKVLNRCGPQIEKGSSSLWEWASQEIRQYFK